MLVRGVCIHVLLGMHARDEPFVVCACVSMHLTCVQTAKKCDPGAQGAFLVRQD